MRQVFRVEVEAAEGCTKVGASGVHGCLDNHETALAELYRITVAEITDRDELEVGDRVDVSAFGVEQVIREVVTGYRVEGQSDIIVYARDELTRLPPKPTFRVERENDHLSFYRNDETDPINTVPMSDPVAIEAAIEHWSANYAGIDREELQKLVDKLVVIDKRELTEYSSCAAIRTARGWYCSLSNVPNAFAGNSPTAGLPVDKATGQGLWPKVKGPYDEQAE